MPTRKRRPMGKRQQRARRQKWLIAGAVVAIAVVTVAVALALRTEEVEGVVRFDDQGNAHIPQPADTYIYNSRPPTSGPHSDGIARWGIHTETVIEWNQVHNLEDGGVIIHYNCPEGCPEIVAELESIVNDVGTDQLILHPYTNMDSRIALTAWTRMLTMDEVDSGKIREFIKAYRGIDHHKPA